jgi:alkanesulfonate monooxygenase SsuD/methylene tetrahydromethanopterin reductase-like flavin-dependent oxidoreductase (luciferase family)
MRAIYARLGGETTRPRCRSQLRHAHAVKMAREDVPLIVIQRPWHDPVLLAERAATLDLLSGGRLDFGVGKGYRHSEFAGFCGYAGGRGAL